MSAIPAGDSDLDSDKTRPRSVTSSREPSIAPVAESVLEEVKFQSESTKGIIPTSSDSASSAPAGITE